MDAQYAERRGEQVLPVSASDPGAEEGSGVDGGDSAVVCGSTSPSLEERIERKRQEAHAKRWAVPEDDVARRAAAAASAATGPTAAAAAFVAAEEAAKRRLAERPEGTGAGVDEGVRYSWRGDFEGFGEEAGDEEDTRPSTLTKVVGGQKTVDFSMFHKEAWERAQRQAEALLAEQMPGVFCWRDSAPHPQQRVPSCAQVKIRIVQTNTEEKINRAYQGMAAGGGSDRNGFLLGASVGRFITLAKEKSDSPEAKNGGDVGWVFRGKLDPKIEEVAFCCPKGACSPPFRVKLASFNLIYCEDRR